MPNFFKRPHDVWGCKHTKGERTKSFFSATPNADTLHVHTHTHTVEGWMKENVQRSKATTVPHNGLQRTRSLDCLVGVGAANQREKTFSAWASSCSA